MPRGGKFMEPKTPSADLAAVIGSAKVSLPESLKKVWVYIKANDLQDAKNRRAINPDEKLKKVFGGKSQVTMFEIGGFLNKNLS